MSLSDRERRLLAEMEAALATDDPRLESRLAGATLTPLRSRVALGVGVILLGLVIIFTGLIAKQTPVGVAGFLVALTGVLLLIRSIGKPGIARTRSRKSLGARLEERWDRRNFQ